MLPTAKRDPSLFVDLVAQGALHIRNVEAIYAPPQANSRTVGNGGRVILELLRNMTPMVPASGRSLTYFEGFKV